MTPEGALRDRLRRLDPAFAAPDVRVEIVPIATNGPMVNGVSRVILTRDSGETVADLIEKSVKRPLGIVARETWFHRQRAVLDGCTGLYHPRCYPSLEGGFEVFLHSEFVGGKPADVNAVAAQLVRGIGEIEARTAAHVAAAPRAAFWSLDFFRPWYMLRPRRRLTRAVAALAAYPELRGCAAAATALAARLRAAVPARARTPRCFCHLDFVRKNLIAGDRGLALIDWGEFQVGRVGFDVGALLASRFVRLSPARFADFAATVAAADRAPPGVDPDVRAANRDWLFRGYALYGCVRRVSLETHRSQGRLAELRDKIAWLAEGNSRVLPDAT